jgi:predicted Rossmann fold flavoprotein
MIKDAVIIGAGASGLMCAIEAGRRGRSVVVIDHAPRVGSKIRVSGGGRCNFTNLNISADHYLSQNRHFCKSALSRYSSEDFIRLLKKHRLSFHEKQGGQLFCEVSASAIIRMLETECRQAGVEFQLNRRIKRVTNEKIFTVETEGGPTAAASLVIATGGLSYPGLGASDFGLRTAERFGIKVIPPRPGLVPLTFEGRDLRLFKALSGVSINAEVSCGTASFRGAVLFTHRGMSGPAILQISSHWLPGSILTINLLPELDAHALLLSSRQSRQEVRNFLSQYLPARFSQKWCEQYAKTGPLCRLTEKELKEMAESLSAWQVRPAGTEGYGSAEVTVGGIDTNEVSSRSMEAKKVSGLFFIGEALDVTGHLGGYNLHWAWASGHAAGQVV